MSVKTQSKTKTLVLLAMFCAMAYVLTVVGRIPVVSFLKYDPKDIVVVIAGFLFGPMSALAVSVVSSLLEMLTVSDTGLIGFLMNVLSTASFACVTAAMYERRRTLRSAIVGLILGIVCMCAVMLLWNYLITPLYMGVSRQDVAAMLLPVFLPFNLLKGFLNASLTLLLYKPIVSALGRAGLVASASSVPRKRSLPLILTSAFVLATCVLCILALQGLL